MLERIIKAEIGDCMARWLWSQDNLMMCAMIGALIFVGISLLVESSRSCDSTNNFVVLDDANMSNQSLSQLYFDCVKYCGDKFSGSQGSKTECFRQCDKVGDFG